MLTNIRIHLKDIAGRLRFGRRICVGIPFHGAIALVLFYFWHCAEIVAGSIRGTVNEVVLGQ